MILMASIYLSMSTTSTETICNDGIDNDGDGYIDCQDGDCGSFSGCLNPDACVTMVRVDCSNPTVNGPTITATLNNSQGTCLTGKGCADFENSIWIANTVGSPVSESFSVSFSKPVTYAEVWGYGLSKDPPGLDADEYGEIAINGSFYKLVPTEADDYSACLDDDYMITTNTTDFPNVEGVWRGQDNTNVDGKLILKYPAGISTLEVGFHNVSGANCYGAAFVIYFADQGTCSFPVEWASFEGIQIGKDVQLDWATASELNSDYFEIQRSDNGEEFEAIGIVTASGNSQSLQSYAFLDSSVAATGVPLLYYRLKEVDLDGKVQFSERIELSLSEIPPSFTIHAYPNPTDGKISIEWKESISQQGQLQLMNLEGKILQSHSVDGRIQSKDLDLENLSAGTYFLRLGFDQVQGSVQIQKR